MINPYSIASQVQQMAAEAEMKRIREFQLRWQAYLGQYPKPLQTNKSDPRGDDNVIVNHARTVVDKGVAFLFGQDIEFELDPDQETAEEEWLDSVWDANKRMSTLAKLGINGGVCGHAFIKIVPQKAPLLPRLIVLDPSTVSVQCSDDDIECVTGYQIQWNTIVEYNGRSTAAVKRQTITPNATGTAWQIVDSISLGDANRFQQTGTALWPYPFPPIADCQNLPNPNEFWGISDIEDDILEPVRGMSFVVSNLMRIIRHHAHPITWASGVNAQQLDTAIGKTLMLPATAQLHNLEMTSDLASSIDLYNKLEEELFLLSRTPAVSLGKLENMGPISGVALRILYQPLIEKTETKRRGYGDMLTEINRRLLVIGGYADNLLTQITWPELLPSDPLQERQVALIDQQLGVSQATILSKLGYDPEQEAQKQQAEAADVGDAVLKAFDGGEGA